MYELTDETYAGYTLALSEEQVRVEKDLRKIANEVWEIGKALFSTNKLRGDRLKQLAGMIHQVCAALLSRPAPPVSETGTGAPEPAPSKSVEKRLKAQQPAPTEAAPEVDLDQLGRDIAVTYDLHCEAIDDPDPDWLADHIAEQVRLWLPAHDARIRREGKAKGRNEGLEEAARAAQGVLVTDNAARTKQRAVDAIRALKSDLPAMAKEK